MGRPTDERLTDEQPGQDSESQDSQCWEDLFRETERGLRAFLSHRLRQPSDIDDCLQAVSMKMVSAGKSVAPASRRAWLFRVAANESARFWRSESAAGKANRTVASPERYQCDPAEDMIRDETGQRVREAIDRLSPTYQNIIRLRIHENLTFRQIADQQGIPIATALTRMRRAMDRLRSDLDETNDADD